MFGIIYLILCILTGMEAVGCLFPHRTAGKWKSDMGNTACSF